jgi:hypothetical protein
VVEHMAVSRELAERLDVSHAVMLIAFREAGLPARSAALARSVDRFAWRSQSDSRP